MKGFLLAHYSFAGSWISGAGAAVISKEHATLAASVIALATVVFTLAAHIFGIDTSGISLMTVSPSISFHDPVQTTGASISGFGTNTLSGSKQKNDTVAPLPPDSAAPSFDCRESPRWAEQRICASPELAAYDRQLDNLYTQAKAGLADNDRLSLRDTQRAWIAQRNACEAESDGIACLQKVYKQRIEQLQVVLHQNTSIGQPDHMTVEAAAQQLPTPVAETRVEPGYPLLARLQGVQGYVIVEFTVAKDGSVQKPRIVGSNPAGLFDQEVLSAVANWRYRPVIVNGMPVDRPGVRVEIDFRPKT